MTEQDVVRAGEDGCEHDMRLDREYDLPDPDPRNPIHVLRCTWCDREVHEATNGMYFEGTRQPRLEYEVGRRRGILGAIRQWVA